MDDYLKYYLTRHSPCAGKQVQVGKVRATLKEALAAAIRIDKQAAKREGRSIAKWTTFIDVVKP